MPDWHPEEIKAAVRKRGVTLAALGRPHGLTRQAMSNALIRPSARAERIIARFLETSPSIIWPSRYCAGGARKNPQPPANYIASPRLLGEGLGE